MILSFKPQFVEKIKTGQKIHTIREDRPQRWKKGRKIHFATGVRTKNYEQFMSGECMAIQAIDINSHEKTVSVGLNGTQVMLNDFDILALARNDGFDTVEEFWKWFDYLPFGFSGKIIHWTHKIYY